MTWLTTISVTDAAVVLGAVTGAVGAAVGILRRVLPWARRLGHLADDLIGEKARPGHPGRPGLMTRVAAAEDAARAAAAAAEAAADAAREALLTASHAVAVAEDARRELKPNGGSSLRDQVDAIRQTVAPTSG